MTEIKEKLDLLFNKHYKKIVKALIRKDTDYEHLSNAYTYLLKATELKEETFLQVVTNAYYASKWYTRIKKKDYNINYYADLFEFDSSEEEYIEEEVNYTKNDIINELNGVHKQAAS